MDLTQASSISKDAIALQVMAAFVRLSANDGEPEIGITRLMKLVYLADRKSLIEHGRPITYSELKAMKHGPVVNRAMRVVHDGLDGGERHMYLKCPSKRAPGGDEKKRPVSASRSLGRDDLDLLSDESMAVIKETWNEWKDVQDIVAATHDLEEYRNCDEWDDDISFYSVLSAGLGENDQKRISAWKRKILIMWLVLYLTGFTRALRVHESLSNKGGAYVLGIGRRKSRQPNALARRVG